MLYKFFYTKYKNIREKVYDLKSQNPGRITMEKEKNDERVWIWRGHWRNDN